MHVPDKSYRKQGAWIHGGGLLIPPICMGRPLVVIHNESIFMSDSPHCLEASRDYCQRGGG